MGERHEATHFHALRSAHPGIKLPTPLSLFPLSAYPQDANLSRSVTHAINGALIGKLLSFTSHTKEANSEAYEEIMATVGSAGERDGRVLYKVGLHKSILFHPFPIGAC
jgi:hypothetical protein